MMKLVTKSLFSAVATGATLVTTAFLSAPAEAFTLSPFTGDDAEVEVTLTEIGGGVQVTANNTGALADIRGIFIDFAESDDAILASITGIQGVSGGPLTRTVIGNDNVSDVGRGSNLNGGGANFDNQFDIGLEIGEPGLKGSKDDFQSTVFNVLGVSLDDFTNARFGARLTSVQVVDGREGSSKLVGTYPGDNGGGGDHPGGSAAIPEPTTMTGLAVAGAGLWASRRKKKQQTKG